jgi:hypothetical protein
MRPPSRVPAGSNTLLGIESSDPRGLRASRQDEWGTSIVRMGRHTLEHGSGSASFGNQFGPSTQSYVDKSADQSAKHTLRSAVQILR